VSQLEQHGFVTRLPTTGESSTRLGETRSTAPVAQHVAAVSSMHPVSLLVGPTAAASGGQDTVTRTSPVAQNQDGFSPVFRDGASSVPSGGGSALASDQSVAGLLVPPATTKTSTVSSADRLSAGPAYPPASSPG
jgi:hypothetical protein